MSSFAKALKSQRKTHRERSQPSARQGFGLLEKKGDWKKRRDDFHRKEKRINALYERARNRNEDEFNYGMIRSRTREGVHIAERDTSKEYTAEELKLLKTQDLRYMTMKETQESRAIEKMHGTLQMLEAAGKKNKHTIFVESTKEARKFNAAKHFDTHPSLVHRSFNRPKIQTLKDQATAAPDYKHIQKLAKKRTGKYKELDQRISRQQQMSKVVRKMQTQKNLLGKGRRVKLDGGKETQYRWKQERKR